MRLEAGISYTKQDYTRQDLSHLDLTGAIFDHCSFVGANLRAAILTDTEFHHCQFNNEDSDAPADLSQASLRGAGFHHCNLTVVEAIRCTAYGVQFQHCQMQGMTLSKSEFRLPIGDSDLVDMTMHQCNFSYGDLSNNYLARCSITDCRMVEVCLDYVDLSHAQLTNNELHNIHATGLTITGADLSGSTFNNLNPVDIDFSQVKLELNQLPQLADILGIIISEADN